jgi:hypothetical protein
MDKKLLNDSKYFEKQEIRWFSVEEMEKNKSVFREFYIKIVDSILSEIKPITAFVKKVSKEYRSATCSVTKTRKRKGG